MHVELQGSNRRTQWLAAGMLAVITALASPAGTMDAERAAADAAGRLAAAPANLAAFAAQFSSMEREWQGMFHALGGKPYSQISSAETDQVESLLFRFLMCREALWDMVDMFGAGEQPFAAEADQTRAAAVSFHAAALLARHTAWLVRNGMDEASAVKKLNEAHYRYDLPSGTFDMLSYALTAPKQLADLQAAQR
jgi:hypothetical protein